MTNLSEIAGQSPRWETRILETALSLILNPLTSLSVWIATIIRFTMLLTCFISILYNLNVYLFVTRIGFLILRTETFFDTLELCSMIICTIYLEFQKQQLYLQLRWFCPLRKGWFWTDHKHRAFSWKGRCSTFLSGCVLPEVLVLNLIQWNSLKSFKTKILSIMVKLKTTFSFGFTLELQRVKVTLSSISKVLRVATETIRTRYRKIT